MAEHDHFDRDEYRAHRSSGDEGGPSLCVDDTSEVELTHRIPEYPHYSQRARLRAATGDLVAATVPFDDEVEAYYRNQLQLGEPHALAVPCPITGSASRCLLNRPESFGALVDWARQSVRLRIDPFMGNQATWELAAALARAAALRVEVLAPPPTLTRMANRKDWFRGKVADCGLRQPPGHTETSLEAVLERCAEISRRRPRLVVKRACSAASLGNLQVDGGEFRSDAGAIRGRITRFLHSTGWDGAEPIVIEEWVSACASPSTHLWIRADGSVRFDAVVEQVLDDQGSYAGCCSTSLPHSVIAELRSSAITMGRVLAKLGYVGRCSFDHLVVGDPRGDFETLIVECNARWGAASLVLRLLERAGVSNSPFRVATLDLPEWRGTRFQELVTAMGDSLYRGDRGTGRFLLFNAGMLPAYGKVGVVCLGGPESSSQELEALRERLRR